MEWLKNNVPLIDSSRIFTMHYNDSKFLYVISFDLNKIYISNFRSVISIDLFVMLLFFFHSTLAIVSIGFVSIQYLNSLMLTVIQRFFFFFFHQWSL